MFNIIISNFGLWFNILIPFIIGFFLVINKKEYSIKEFGLQMLITIIILTTSYLILFSTTTDLVDTEFWNGKVKNTKYFEEWTEEVTYTETYECGTSKNPQTCTRLVTRNDYHSPYYIIETSNSETINIKENHFLKSQKKFGSKKENLNRINQVSYGDGNVFISKPNKIIPVSVPHNYINYVTASKYNVINQKVNENILKMLIEDNSLRPYPKLYRGEFGETKLKRVINSTKLKFSTKEYLNKLNKISAQYGKSKEINPIIYFTTKGEEFTYYLKSYWKNAKKNDFVFLIGIDEKLNIKWTDSIAWTDNQNFLIDSKNGLKNININNNGKVLSKVEELINIYKRKSMEDFKYLKENITISWYWQLLIVLINIVLSALTFIKLQKN